MLLLSYKQFLLNFLRFCFFEQFTFLTSFQKNYSSLFLLFMFFFDVHLFIFYFLFFIFYFLFIFSFIIHHSFLIIAIFSICSALGRPTLFPLPSIVAQAIFGEFGDEVLLGKDSFLFFNFLFNIYI